MALPVALTVLVTATSLWADETKCWDFSRRITKPLMTPPKLNPKGPVFEEGRREKDGVEYAAGRGVANRSIRETLTWLLDHTNWKDMSKSKLKVRESRRPGYIAFHTVDVDVNVWAFIHIDWVEEWAYALLEGSLANPRHVLASYQKIAGTRHLEHLCGQVELRRLSPTKTDVFLYEEARADRYKAPNMRELHINNLHKLNGEKIVVKEE